MFSPKAIDFHSFQSCSDSGDVAREDGIRTLFLSPKNVVGLPNNSLKVILHE